MNIIMAGAGSIALKHIAAIKNINHVTIVSLVGGDAEETQQVAEANNIPHWTLELSESLAIEGVEAVILATPTPLHAEQAIQVMDAGKHVLIEIPMGMSLKESRHICNKQMETGLTAMVCHTRRFNPPHQWIHQQLRLGELHLHHLVVETVFHRRENRNALGKARNWADHLLWHHACHSVDLFAWQTQAPIIKRWAQQGPVSKIIGVPLDMSVGMQAVGGALCTVALSFNHDGPLGSWFKYICEEGTFKVRYNDMTDGWDKPYKYEWDDLSDNGIELQDREFFNAIKNEREPNASVTQCLEIMEILHKMEFLANN